MERWIASERVDSFQHGDSSQLWPIFKTYVAENGFIRPTDDPITAASSLYFPMSRPHLPFELVKAAEGDEQAVLRFVRAWGLLGYDDVKAEQEKPRQGDPVEFVLEQAARVKELLDTLERIKEGETELWGVVPSMIKLEGVSFTLRQKYVRPIAYESARELVIGGPRPSETSRTPSGVWKAHAQFGQLMPKDSPQGVRRELVWRALIDVINFHLATYASGERLWGRCEECGDYFEPKDARQRFCPPSEEERQFRARPQSLCGLRKRARNSRLRNQKKM